MRKRLIHRLAAVVLTAAGVWFCAGAVWADPSQDATVTVTPVADLSLSLSAPSYAFGPIEVGDSTNSAQAVTLTNNGNVSVTVSKEITVQSVPAGWIAGTDAGRDTYVLYSTTSTARPGLDEFTAATRFGAQGDNTPLTGSSGVPPVLPPTGTGQNVDLWFRLDMPTEVSSQASRSITIRFKGSAQ